LDAEALATVEKPVLDEGAFQQLLAAAYVVQQQLDQLRMARQSQGARFIGKPASDDALAIIAETQEKLRSRAWDLDLASNLVAEGLQKITRAKGVAIALERHGMLHYAAATGTVSGLAGISLPMPPDLSLGPLSTGNSDPAAIPATRQPSGEQNEVALPLSHDGRIAGILEVRFMSAIVPEAELRCCQLMAGLLTDVIARTAEARWKKSLSAEHATMLEELEQALPQLNADLNDLSQSSAESRPQGGVPKTHAEAESEPVSVQSRVLRGRRRSDRSQRKRGWQPVAQPQAEVETPSPDSPDSEALALSGPHPLTPRTETPDALSSADASDQDEIPNPWLSSVHVRQWLESLDTRGNARKWVARHRSDIYLAAALGILVISIGLFIRAPQLPPQPKPQQPQLTLFERVLVALDLAVPPTNPTYAGDPDTMVWVDLRTALYYCPGAGLYGKTEDGKFTTQRDAQLDQFQPAERKSCK
jgi:hypothetical protein